MLNELDVCTCEVFRPGVEYVYRYESEALTGIRTVSDELSGVKVRANVKIQIHRDGTSLLKVCSFTWNVIQVQIINHCTLHNVHVPLANRLSPAKE